MDTLITIVSLFAVALAALALVLAVVRMLDRWIFPNLSFEQALRENNLAVAVFLAALVLGLFLLVGRAVAAPGVDSGRYDDDFRREARLRFGYGTDWRWFKAQGIAESGLDPAVCSAAGACGLMQFMPGTALAMGLQNRFDARASIRAGIAYDKQLWDEFTAPRPLTDRLFFTFAAYNWGLGHVLRRAQPCARERFGADHLFRHIAPCLPAETQDYVPRIQAWRERLRARAGLPQGA